MRDPQYKIALVFEDADGNNVTLATDVPENQVKAAHANMLKLAASLKDNGSTE